MIIPDFDGICRLCMKKSEKMVSIYRETQIAKPGLSEQIEKCACVKVHKNDGLPGTMCTDCLFKLDQITEFQELCKRSDDTFREILTAKETDIQAEEVKSRDQNIGKRRDKFRKISRKISYKEATETSDREADPIKCQEATSNAESTQQDEKRKIKSIKCTDRKGNCLDRTRVINYAQMLKDSCDEGVGQSQKSIAEIVISSSYVKCESDPLVCIEDPQVIHPQSKLRIKQVESSSLRKSEESNAIKEEDTGSNDTNSDNEEYQWPGSLSDEDLDQSHSMEISKKNEQENEGPFNILLKKTRKLHECEYCGRAFPRSNHLAQHELTHTKEKPFHCSYCQKSFWYKNSLIGHIKQTHTGDVNYTCEECGRGFFQRSEFKRHLLIHSNEAPFKCDECGMCFKVMKYLKRHQKVHSALRNHTCQYCGKSFRMLQTLRVHLVLHSGEKPYKCSYCEKSFSQSAPLKAHTRMHTGERPYICSFCGATFPTGNALKAHTFKHTGIHPNSCKDCSIVFKRKRDLLDHQEKVHNGAVTASLQVTPQLCNEGHQAEMDLEEEQFVSPASVSHSRSSSSSSNS